MLKKVAIYPGSFDPPTYGHLDLVNRALKIFDCLIIAVTTVDAKNHLFTVPERVALMKEATAGLKKVKVESFSGLLVNYARAKKAAAIVRGLRAIADFEYEFQMALMNRHLSAKAYAGDHLEIVYLMPDEKYTYTSSTLVKQVAKLKGNVKHFVPPCVEKSLRRRFA